MNSSVPDHFYDGKVPVFRPTMEEFCDFKSYMESINHFGMDAGILKIIPPKDWRDKLPDLTNKLETIRLKRPIVQHIIGSQGIYTQTNIEKRRSYTINQWYELCHDVYHRPPPFDREKVYLSTRTSRKKRPRNISHLNEPIPATSVVQPPTISSDTIHVVSTPPRSPNTPVDSHLTGMVGTNDEQKIVLDFEALPTVHAAPQSPPKTPPQKKSDNDALNSLDDDIYGDRKDGFEAHHEKLTFDYHCQHPERYDEKYCRELERNYWRNLTFNQPMYGADMSGTLFDERTSSWNVNNLDNILNRININLPGVNTPYLYYGMWKATFAWHVEDMDLYSINYLHFGAPKQWYVIPTAHRQRFERVMQGIFWEDYKKCGQFLRHKTFIVSPTVLANHSIPVHRLVQHEGEFVVTFPFGYHSGYNLGFNCAESVNFAFESWIDIGKVARSCACIGDSVNIDVSIFEKAVNGESKVDDKHIDLGGGSWHQAAQIVQAEKKTYKGTKKRKIEAETTREKTKQYGISRKIPKSELMQQEPQKCILCPNLGADITTENGKFAHRICAEFIPETMVAIDEETQTNMVFGIFDIPNARRKLKCQICNTANGAGIQCAQPKCYRAYHPTCAKNSSIFIQSTTFEDGSVLYECFCNQHSPNAIVDRTRQKEDMLIQLSQSMTIGQIVHAKWRGGSHYVGTIVEKFEEKQSCKIIFEDGSKSTVLWKNIQLSPPQMAELP